MTLVLGGGLGTLEINNAFLALNACIRAPTPLNSHNRDSFVVAAAHGININRVSGPAVCGARTVRLQSCCLCPRACWLIVRLHLPARVPVPARHALSKRLRAWLQPWMCEKMM
jgi:hypothetical protein